MDIYEFLTDANTLQIETEKQERIALQTKTISTCNKLSTLAELSMKLDLVGMNTIEHWQKLISDVKYMTVAWRNKDKKR